MAIPNHGGYFSITAFICLLLSSAFASAQIFYSITDKRDGQTYRVVKIGEQWWMAQNLNIGNMINAADPQQDNYIIEKYCPADNLDHCNIYGGLYQYDELMQYGHVEFNQGICPSGWHVPSDMEWKTLELFLGMDPENVDTFNWRGTNEAGKLKAVEPFLWHEPNACATNEVGFSALPAGGTQGTGVYDGLGYMTDYWCADLYEGQYPWFRYLLYDSCKIYRNSGDRTYGTSVRCIKDSPFIFGRGMLIDPREGKEYRTVLIGNHWWMAENLNYGTWIDTLGNQKNDDNAEKYCYDNDGRNCDEFGGLYQWNEMMNYDPENKQGICPDGWHIPTDDDWKELEFAAGMTEMDLDKSGWVRGNLEGEFMRTGGGSGYEAEMGGGVSSDKRSRWKNEFGFIWTSDQFDDHEAWLRGFHKDTSTMGRILFLKQDALSVRCVSNNDEILALSIEAEDSVCAGQDFAIKARVSGESSTKSFSWTSDPPGFYSTDSMVFVQAQTDTKYRVRVTEGYLYARDSVLVTVKPQPLFTVTGNDKVCSSTESVEYSVTLNGDYHCSWFPSEGSHTPISHHQTVVEWDTTPGNKVLGVEVKDIATGCSDRKNYNVEILESPPKPVIVRKGDHLLICPDSGSIYRWFQNDVAIPGADRQFYYAKSNKSGSFMVETQLENLCRNISEPFGFLAKSSGESGMEEVQTVFISPNPTGGNVIMDIISDYTGRINVRITNIMGSVVGQRTFYKQNQVFDTIIELGGLAEGCYFIMVEYGINREVHRITVQK